LDYRQLNRFKCIFCGVLIIIFLCLPLAAAAQQQPATAPPAKSGELSGKITAIDMTASAVVVEVPMGKQMFTVGGPLAPKAKLTKHGKPAKLGEFKQGDQVSVGFKSTAQGPVIQSLSAK
jgi:hypothetical protein